jgi:branched-chain amino acid transport system ATP-binding protein
VTAASLLSVENLSAGYAAGLVLHGVSLRLEAGEAVCVLGPNGAGKSTLMRALSGVAPRVTGAVVMDGRAIHRLPAHRRVRLGLVQVPEGRRSVISTLSVDDNLRLAGQTMSAATFRDRLADVRALFPFFAARGSQPAGTLSGGQQQMLAIALALILGPKLLLIDEPSAGLAPVLVEEVFDRLRGLRERGVSVLIAEQQVGLALEVATRGYVLESGRIVYAGGREDLLTTPILAETYLGGR